MNSNWLESVKVGDPICVVAVAWGGAKYIKRTGEVARLTATQVISSWGERYSRKRGLVVGDGQDRIEPLTQAIIDADTVRKSENRAVREIFNFCEAAQKLRGADAVALSAKLKGLLK